MTACQLPTNEAEFCIWPQPPSVPEYDVRYKGRKAAILKDGRQYGDSIQEVLAAFEGRQATVTALVHRTRLTAQQVGAAIRNLRDSHRVWIVKPSRGSACAVYAPTGGER